MVRDEKVLTNILVSSFGGSYVLLLCLEQWNLSKIQFSCSLNSVGGPVQCSRISDPCAYLGIRRVWLTLDYYSMTLCRPCSAQEEDPCQAWAAEAAWLWGRSLPVHEDLMSCRLQLFIPQLYQIAKYFEVCLFSPWFATGRVDNLPFLRKLVQYFSEGKCPSSSSKLWLTQEVTVGLCWFACCTFSCSIHVFYPTTCVPVLRMRFVRGCCFTWESFRVLLMMKF